jgi:thymidylate synthase
MNKILSKEEFLEKLKTDREFNDEFGNKGIDQISDLIKQLKENPDSRRLLVSVWNISDLPHQVLPPCHYGFQVYTRELSDSERAELMDKKYGIEKPEDRILPWLRIDIDNENLPTRAISLMFNMRSIDTFLGLPFNIASYGLLLEIIAKEVNMVPDQLIGNLGDVHLYSNHIEQAKEQIGRKYTHEERTELLKQAMGEERYDKAVDELMPFGGGLSEYYDSYKIPNRTREPFPLPTLKIENDVKWEEGDCLPYYSVTDFSIENYQSHPTIKAPLSN